MDYATILAMSLGYADRTDDEVANNIPNFIRVVESRINRFLKTREMSVRTIHNSVANQEYYSLPTDFNGLRDIEVKDVDNPSSICTLSLVSPEQMNQRITCKNSEGVYTIVGNQLQIYPILPANKILEIIYYRKLIGLTEASSTNWLSLSNPDVYIFGLLVEINAFTKDVNATTLWDTRFKESLESLKDNDEMNRWSGTSLQMRTG